MIIRIKPYLSLPRLALLTLLLLIAACGHPAYVFHEDLRINEALESYRPLPGYTYYYSGPEDFPLAILGIRPEYRLKKEFWIPVKLTEKKLQDWMEIIDNPHRNLRTRYRGKVIRTPEGEEIGIWYSPQEWSTVKMGEDREVTVYSPFNTLYHKVSGNQDGFP
ncbi:MAG: hypothetical protein KKE83_02395 [Proteobacteria bacterium]|nr:hypothetical protein [Pseudomonadota bacterium]MBU1546049.1 hypothetical protein [Pseudomonadota bacterium]MBU2618515.1 hypothetical protein [Pseudomonadota bacterium]